MRDEDGPVYGAAIATRVRGGRRASYQSVPNSRFAPWRMENRFVVSEHLGVPELEDYFQEGVVFVDAADLGPTIVFYLRRPDLRERIARRGFELMTARPQWAALADAVDGIERKRGCNATAAAAAFGSTG